MATKEAGATRSDDERGRGDSIWQSERCGRRPDMDGDAAAQDEGWGAVVWMKHVVWA